MIYGELSHLVARCHGGLYRSSYGYRRMLGGVSVLELMNQYDVRDMRIDSDYRAGSYMWERLEDVRAKLDERCEMMKEAQRQAWDDEYIEMLELTKIEGDPESWLREYCEE